MSLVPAPEPLELPALPSCIYQVAQAVLELGPGAQLAKIDIKSAYRVIPVHPDDWPLLGMVWEYHVYIDVALPFGLRSAPKLFNTVADALEWIAKHLAWPWHRLGIPVALSR